MSGMTTAVFLLAELKSIGWLCLTYLLLSIVTYKYITIAPETFDLTCKVILNTSGKNFGKSGYFSVIRVPKLHNFRSKFVNFPSEKGRFGYLFRS